MQTSEAAEQRRSHRRRAAFYRQQSFSTLGHFAPGPAIAEMKVCVSSKICHS